MLLNSGHIYIYIYIYHHHHHHHHHNPPVGVQCPISSSLGEFPSYWDWLWCPGLLPVLVSIALPFAFHTWCFPFALICHRISIVFPLYGRRLATHSVDPSLTHCSGEFPGLGLALVPNVVVPEAEQRCAWGRKLDPNVCPELSEHGAEPRTLPLDYRAQLLLVASDDMQEATAGQF